MIEGIRPAGEATKTMAKYMITLHARHQPTTHAGIELREAVLIVVKKYELTYGELFHILAQITLSWATGAVREERGDRQVGE